MWLELDPEADVSELGEVKQERLELRVSSLSAGVKVPLGKVIVRNHVCIVAVLSFLHQREKRQPFEERFPYLRGRFGFVVPLDFIGSMSNRWSYGVAFGAVTPSVLQLFSESYTPFPVPNWAKAFVYLIGALEVGVAYMPFFACLSTPHRALGGVLGLLYTLAWLIVRLWDVSTCPGGEVEEEKLVQAHQFRYVQTLLRRPTERLVEKSWLRRKVYDWDPYFKFPNRMIGTSVISLIGLYMVSACGLAGFCSQNLPQERTAA
ncbi:hypothetical protein MHYP_G00250470 [Metynnis hypsauchen]